jgi:hypothetical protein
MKNFFKLILICATGLIFITPSSLWAAKSFNRASPKTNTALLAISGTALTGGMPPVSAPILSVSNDGLGASWTNITRLPTQGRLVTVSCSGNNVTGYCVAAGTQTNVGSYIITSNDAGRTFSPITIPNLDATFSSSSCVLNNCIITGVSRTGPIIVAENGITGHLGTLTGFPTTTRFMNSSCVGSSGGNAICVAVGSSNSNPISSSLPVLGVSTDTGNSWGVANIIGVPANAALSSVSCTGAVGSAICAAVGSDYTSNIPLAVFSNDGTASTWNVLSLPALPANSAFAGVSCTGSGSTAICAAAGNGQDMNTFLYVSVDGGVTWTHPTITGLPVKGSLTQVSCAGTGSNAVCMAIGQDQTADPYPPLLVTSTDGGVSWAVVNVPGITKNGYYRSIACTNATNDPSAAVCTIVGNNFTDGMIQVTTSDSGATWTKQTIQSNWGYFSTTATG